MSLVVAASPPVRIIPEENLSAQHRSVWTALHVREPDRMNRCMSGLRPARARLVLAARGAFAAADSSAAGPPLPIY